MKNSQIRIDPTITRVPKAEAIEQITRRITALKEQLDMAQAQLKAAVSPGKYALNIQVGTFKKQIHACKAQLDRIKKDPKADVVWPDRLSA
jgi:predicted  nucleic acid-binding Zn-ribbon protein